ncbi:MAG: porin [Pirellulaceae bacterium]|jgi:hypothetical protein|nr:porin [Pirellulaceae bacterium]
MNITYRALAAVCGCALLVSPVGAQSLRHPASVRPVSGNTLGNDFGYYRYYDAQEEASPSDAPPAEPVPEEPAAAEPAAPATDACEACAAPVSCCSCDSCFLFGPDEPFTVFPGDNCWGITAGFWSQIGYHTEGVNGIGDGLTNDYPNRVQLHQQWFYLEKKVDTGGCGFDWGFRGDYVYGTDGPDTQAFGNRPDTWDFGWNNGGAYGHAIPQLYAELGFNNLTAKIGHFNRIVGYEVMPATGNFFYSHAFAFYLAQPFTHTGVLLEQKVSDDFTVVGGWTAGWDTGFDRNGGSNFLGGFRMTLTEKMAFSYLCSLGNAGFANAGVPGSDDNGNYHNVLVTWDFRDNWQYVAEFNYGDNDLLVNSTEDVVGFGNYLFYTFNDCWKAGARLEWFRDPRINSANVRGAENEITNFTVGLNYRPAANVVLRPELRWLDFHDTNPLRDTFLFGIDTVITY